MLTRKKVDLSKRPSEESGHTSTALAVVLAMRERTMYIYIYIFAAYHRGGGQKHVCGKRVKKSKSHKSVILYRTLDARRVIARAPRRNLHFFYLFVFVFILLSVVLCKQLTIIVLIYISVSN